MEKKTLNENTAKDELAQWRDEAKKQTLETLPAFLKHLTEDYQHDYGTICHAIAAAAVGAAYAVEHSPQGGITGFQSSAVMWGMIQGWQSSLRGKPLRLVDYSEYLYPQYGHKVRGISADTANFLKREAGKLLEERKEDYVHPDVVSHWRSLAKGELPFGLQVED